MFSVVLLLAAGSTGLGHNQAYATAQGPSKVLPAAQAPSKIMPAPSKVMPAPQAPAKIMPAPAKVLPAPFRPRLIHGAGMAGVCLIRLQHLRPRFLPAFLGLSSENAAHRIAVQWDEGGQRREGVFIPRRDTSSRLNTLAGGRLFPGLHHHATFRVQEDGGRYRVALDSDDRRTHLAVEGQVAPALPPDSVFHSLAEASAFFERGSLGYSVTARPGVFDGLELRSLSWHVDPLAVERV